MKRFKMITPTGTMSNLVGCWAISVKENSIKAILYISGKCGSSIDGNDYYIVQAISPLDGSANVAKILQTNDLLDLIILPTKEIAELVIADYWEKDSLRYQFPDIK